MTRPIKFRAWDRGNERWASEFYLDRKEKIGKYGAVAVIAVPEETHILMQFTGLLDKNGKEVYEGDIFASGTYRVIPWSVVYVEKWGKFVLVGKTKYASQSTGEKRKNIIWRSIQKASSMEVIGNVWENPELLT